MASPINSRSGCGSRCKGYSTESDKWAGNIALNHGYNQVEASWTVPCISSSSYKPADSNLSHPRQAYFVIEDYSTQKYVTIADGDGSFNTLSDGTTAEWIVERVQPTYNNISGPFMALADFSPTEMLFTAALTIQNGVTEYVGQTTHTYNILYDYDANWCGDFCPVELAHPQSISGNGQNFPIHFDASY